MSERRAEDVRTGGGLGEHPQELIMHLERDQLVAETLKALPPARIGPRALAALWALRVFVVVVGAMVIYTFVARLG